MRILLTGAAGQLGKALIRELLKKEHGFVEKLLLTVNSETSWNALYNRMKEEELSDMRAEIIQLDITDVYAVRTAVKNFMPDVIINSASYTAVDACESDYENARLVNEDGVRNLADIAKEINAVLVHISTDYVFDGESPVPYREEDEVGAVNLYGKTKVLGEETVKKALDRYFVIRTAWLYGEGKNFVKTMLRLSETNKELRVVSDQTGSPTSAAELARFIAYIIQTEKYGIWHAVCGGSTSWFEFAKKIMEFSGKTDVKVLPIRSEEYKTAAKRPKYSVLSTDKVNKNTDFRFKDWQEELAEYLKINN